MLGPHPLLAEALHVRLSEAGLARADRARLFTVATAADGIILATVGGEEAVQAAGVTGMLLAARLAVPVLAAALDEEGAIAQAAEQLRSSGSQQLALAPYLIGPEIAAELLHAAAEEAGCSAAEALGPYPAVGKLVVASTRRRWASPCSRRRALRPADTGRARTRRRDRQSAGAALVACCRARVVGAVGAVSRRHAGRGRARRPSRPVAGCRSPGRRRTR